MQKLFRPSVFITLYRGEKNLKGVLSPSLFPPKLIKNEISISSCNKCDICKNYLIYDNKPSKCNVTGRMYSVSSSLTCNSPNVFLYYIL